MTPLIIKLYLPDGLILPSGFDTVNVTLGLRLLAARTRPVFDYPELVRLRAVPIVTVKDAAIVTILGTIDYYGGPAAETKDQPICVGLTMIDSEPVVGLIQAFVPATHFETLSSWNPAAMVIEP